MGGRIYSENFFSPKYISIQILTLVSSYYAIYTSLLIGISLLTKFELPKGPFESKLSRSHVFAQLFTAAALSWVVKVVVERSRKVLDFIFTVHLINLFLTSVIAGFPETVAWWIVQALALALSTIGGEILCRREESADILLTSLERE